MSYLFGSSRGVYEFLFEGSTGLIRFCLVALRFLSRCLGC